MKISVLSDTTYRSSCPDFEHNLSFYGSEPYHCVIAKGLSDAGHDVHFFAPHGSQDNFGTFHALKNFNGGYAEHEILDMVSLEGLTTDYLAQSNFDFILDFTAIARNVEELFNYHGFRNYGVFRNGYTGYNVPRLRIRDRHYIVPSHQNKRIFEKHGFPDVHVCVIGDTIVDYENLLAIHQNKPKTNTMVEIETDNDVLVCTPDHKIFTQRGWVQAKDLIARVDYCYTNKYASETRTETKGLDTRGNRISAKELFYSFYESISERFEQNLSSDKIKGGTDGIKTKSFPFIQGNTKSVITGVGKSVYSWYNRWRRIYNSINDQGQTRSIQPSFSSFRNSKFFGRALYFYDKEIEYPILSGSSTNDCTRQTYSYTPTYFEDEYSRSKKNIDYTRTNLSISDNKEETSRTNNGVMSFKDNEVSYGFNYRKGNRTSKGSSEVEFEKRRINSIRFKRIDRETERVYDLTTLNHTFFADNILTHNCYYGIPDFYCKQDASGEPYQDMFVKNGLRWGFNDYFLYPHRPTPEKGSQHILELAQVFPEETFVFMVSNNPVTQHKDALQSLKKECVNKSLQNVKFVELPLNNKHHYFKRELMRHAKAVLSPFNPSIYLEGFGLANAEAVACGTPLLITDSESSRELWIDEKDGLIIPYDDRLWGFKQAIKHFSSYDFKPENKFTVDDCISNYENYINRTISDNDNESVGTKRL